MQNHSKSIYPRFWNGENKHSSRNRSKDSALQLVAKLLCHICLHGLLQVSMTSRCVCAVHEISSYKLIQLIYNKMTVIYLNLKQNGLMISSSFRSRDEIFIK